MSLNDTEGKNSELPGRDFTGKFNALSGVSVPKGRSKRILRNHESRLFIVQVFLSCSLISITFIAVTFNKLNTLPELYKLLLIVSILLLIIIYPMLGVYRQSLKLSTMVYRVTMAWLVTIAILIAIGFLTKTSEYYSREIIITWFVVVALLQIPLLKFNNYAASIYRKRYTKPIPSLVVGLGRTARYLTYKINRNYWMPDVVIGMVNGLQDTVPSDVENDLSAPLLGKLDNINEIIDKYQIKRIYVSLPLRLAAKVEELNDYLVDFHVDVIWVLDLSDWKLLNHSVREVAGIPIICLNESPVMVSRVMISIKHFTDKLISVVMLVLLAPLLVITAIAVKITSPGPILFKQQRNGYDGSVIYIWKFRSMRVHEDSEVKQATKDDLRITKLGAFLRRSSIDELPQLFNVLQGSMSLVGPRPHAIAHNHYYSARISTYMVRHRIKPGITGLAQINGCRGETETIDKMQRRVDYDLQYINNWSLWEDYRILLKTPLSLLSKDIY
ncbi:MAG: undecaprenyl-phosphate glucose phosphotransferase [Oceanospirillaceae bacterium]|nr:undecaprenyl-phosphate glucose phosphotransferase [Oceanospirillaceae bacterium]